MVVDDQHAARSVTLTNDYGNGSVTLTKTVEGEIAPAGAAFSFALVADGASPASGDVRVLHSGETTTWDGLTAGRYRLVELTTGGFTPTWNPGDVVEISSAHRHASVLVTNDYGEAETGWISITTVVTGGLAPDGARFDVRLDAGRRAGGPRWAPARCPQAGPPPGTAWPTAPTAWWS